VDQQWIVIDSKVYDLSKFANVHPGGANVLFVGSVGQTFIHSYFPTSLGFDNFLSAGRDATQVFFGLHRHEVLLRPQYARLQIGTIRGQEEVIKPPVPGELSKVPYAEPTWLVEGYHSPYYTDNHRQFQKATRKFFVEVVYPHANRCEENGKRIPQELVDKMRYVARGKPGSQLSDESAPSIAR
jgi:prepilin-type processing-associated H-X9-DG protein